MTIDCVALGPTTLYRALGAIRLQRANHLRNSSQFYLTEIHVSDFRAFISIYLFIGFLRRPTDILRMQSIFRFTVETKTPP